MSSCVTILIASILIKISSWFSGHVTDILSFKPCNRFYLSRLTITCRIGKMKGWDSLDLVFT